MFKNRELRVKMVKPEVFPIRDTQDPEKIAKVVKEVVNYTAVAAVSVYASKVALELAKEVILLKVTPSR